MFYMTILRDESGEVLARGRGRKFKATAERLYNEATGYHPRRCVGLCHHFPVAEGSVAGSYQVQFAYRVGKIESLDPMVLIRVWQ